MTWYIVSEGEVREAPVKEGETGAPRDVARWGRETFGYPASSYGTDWIAAEAKNEADALSWAKRWDAGEVPIEFKLFAPMVHALGETPQD